MAEHPAVRTVFAPYDPGHRGLRMGAGPDHLWDNGLPQMLRSENRPSLHFVHVLPEVDPPTEVATAFELDRQVSEQAREAVSEGEFPLVLSGNCNTAVGTIAGLGAGNLGVVWFDAHADFNTPETTATGFTDGMGLAIAVGHCWKKMAEGVPGFTPVAEEHVVLAGVRAVEPSEEERLGSSDVTVAVADSIRREGLRALEAALDKLKGRVGRVHVHLDLDVLDPAKVGPANELAPEGGLTAEDLETALGMVTERFAVAAAGIAPPTIRPSTRTGGSSVRRSRARGCSRPRRRPPSRNSGAVFPGRPRLDFGVYRAESLVAQASRTARTDSDVIGMVLGYRYPRIGPVAASLIPVSSFSFLGHPSVVGIQTARNSSVPHSSAR